MTLERGIISMPQVRFYQIVYLYEQLKIEIGQRCHHFGGFVALLVL